MSKKSKQNPCVDSTLQCGGVETPTFEINDDGIYQCTYCKKVVSRKDALKRHVEKYCKQKIIIEKNKLQQVIDEQNIIINQSGNNNMIQNSNNTTNNITNNNTTNNYETKLVAFGKEDLSYIADSVYKKLFTHGFMAVQQLIEYIHLNENKPENMNIHLTNLKDKYLSFFDGDDWKLTGKKDFLDNLYYKNADSLLFKFQELSNELNKDENKKFKRFLDHRDDEDIMKSIIEDIKLILYNNRKHINQQKKSKSKAK